MREMLVVRLGGSHAFSPLLRPWLAAIETAAGDIVLVPGGGPFADTVRSAQREMGFHDVAAHHMGLVAMMQYGLALAGLSDRLRVTDTLPALQVALARDQVPIWSPWPMLRNAPDIAASWNVTSDSLALWLARALGAPRTLFIKHRSRSPAAATSDLVAEGTLDAAFPAFLDAYTGEVWLAGPEDVPTVITPRQPPGWCLRGCA
jgi:5-(aminomethyl)-3-furanmethanol phosphate kinase